MSPPPPTLTLAVRTEQDVVQARRAAREAAEALGFDGVDCTRVATAVSEVARNAFAYAGGGQVHLSAQGRMLEVRVVDQGPGIPHLDEVLTGRYRSSTGMGLGLLGAHQLMDDVQVHTRPGQGTEVLLRKHLPSLAPTPAPSALAPLAARLPQERPPGVLEEVAVQNRELVKALDALRARQAELERLNSELEETNRGVVALYAELDETAKALREASDTKSRFLSNISHEFRTPLNSIRALSDILKSRADGPLTPEQERQVGFIHAAADALAELIEDLLDIQKIEAGKEVLRPRRFTVEELLATMRGVLRPLHTSPAVELVLETEPGLPPLYTDEGKLAQVLRNLLSNALKFTEQGTVALRVRRGPEGLVRFAVSDTGVGIRPEDQERVFEEFVQVPGPHQKAKGTGLGLPLSRRLMALLGGTLTLESVPGRGSTFTAALPPLAPQALAEAPEELKQAWAQALARPSAPRPRILLVDDDPIARYLLRRMLGDDRWTVEEAEGGAEGLRLARSEPPPDLLFLDLAMPDLTGQEVLAALRQEPATAGLPVVVNTVGPLTDAERAALERQALAVLYKRDLTRERIHALVEQALARRGHPGQEERHA